jgi:hypothetical protein
MEHKIRMKLENILLRMTMLTSRSEWNWVYPGVLRVSRGASCIQGWFVYPGVLRVSRGGSCIQGCFVYNCLIPLRPLYSDLASKFWHSLFNAFGMQEIICNYFGVNSWLKKHPWIHEPPLDTRSTPGYTKYPWIHEAPLDTRTTPGSNCRTKWRYYRHIRWWVTVVWLFSKACYFIVFIKWNTRSEWNWRTFYWEWQC